MLELLKKVLKPVAPSGLEEPVAAVIREEVAPYVDSIETDALGNLICVKNGTEANPEKIMLSAHMDHIGYIVTGIEKEGFLRVTNVGGISPTMSLTRHVSFPNGVQGVVVSEVSKDTAMKDLFVDIGAQDKADAETMVRVGDVCVYANDCFQLGGEPRRKSRNGRPRGVCAADSLPANRRRDEANHHCRFLRAGGSRLPRREGGVVRESAGQGHRH